jgi:hypothetical protein
VVPLSLCSSLRFSVWAVGNFYQHNPAERFKGEKNGNKKDFLSDQSLNETVKCKVKINLLLSDLKM